MRSATITAEEIAGCAPPERPLALEFAEYASVTTLLMEELGGAPFGSPATWRRAAVAGLEAHDLTALAPFVRARPHELPSSLCSLPHRTASGLVPLEDDLERIATSPVEPFVAQLPRGGDWTAVARHPRRWLDRFARAVRRAGEGLRGQWREAGGLLEREAERVGVAAVRGSVPALLATQLGPSTLRLEGPQPPRAELRPHLGMVPLLAGPGAAHVWIIEGDLTHLAYPLPDAWRLLDRPASEAAALDALVGVQRALILRMLDRPLTPGKIAEALMAVPSAASHHLAILERAGLVLRDRRGRQVLVRRTARGTQLVAIYDDA
jgi:DNA-binding transcriptional ArsR family regulator